MLILGITGKAHSCKPNTENVMDDKMILIDSDEAAKLAKVTGWVSRDGRFFGNDERLARMAGCTHTYCEACKKVIPKGGWTLCPECRESQAVERYNALPRVEWDEETPLYSDAADEYFFTVDELEYHMEEHKCTVRSLRLIVCEANQFQEVSIDHFCDELPEDGDLTAELVEALEELNKVIRRQPPASWTPGKYAALVELYD
jgi:hypothetical protein